MQEEKIYIENGSRILEGLISKSSADKCVVICHPHSLMGGSMYNNVVEAIQEAFASQNYSTLRFNFRGVGESSGRYDEGEGESRDILAVCDFLKKQGCQQLYFAGYSFGAWVGSKIIGGAGNPFLYSTFVSPPLNYFEFEWDGLKNAVNLLVLGDKDPFCEKNVLILKAKEINSPLEIIPGADHFYTGKEDELIHVLNNQMKDITRLK